MKLKNALLTIISGAVVLYSCSSDDNINAPEATGAYQSGILISNEGPFNNGTGTVSFVNQDLTEVENGIYSRVNEENIGNVVQSIGFTEEEAFIIANVSNTIQVVSRYTFEKIASITEGLNNPRYFVAVNGKGYVSNWGDPNDLTDDYIAVINLTSNLVEGTIAVDFGPEELLVYNDAIYVAHQGGFGQNNKISVITTNSAQVATTITVGDVPNSMQVDSDGNLWVLSGGKPAFTEDETSGSLSKISTTSNQVLSTLVFDSAEHPNHLSYDNTKLYYTLSGSVYSMLPSDNELPTIKDFEDLEIYSMTVFDGKLFVTDAKDFASNGELSMYSLASGEALNTIEVGLIPGGIYFN